MTAEMIERIGEGHGMHIACCTCYLFDRMLVVMATMWGNT